MTVTHSGTYPSEDVAKSIELRSDGISAEIITHGASLRQLVIDLPSGPRNVVLGLPDLATYIAHGSHVGATAGPYAGRVPFGRVNMGQEICQLNLNAGEHHVHGGVSGLGRRNWTLVEHSDAFVKLAVTSADGDEGYPGDLSISCMYALIENGLEITLSAQATADTPINLLHHGYFNLDGEGTVADHSLAVASDKIIQRDTAGIPTGSLVAATPAQSFNSSRKVGSGNGFDQTFVLDDAVRTTPRSMATLVSASCDLIMEVLSTEPQLHFYDGGKLNVCPASGKGPTLTSGQGLCLEPCRAVVTDDDRVVGSTVLKKGKRYRQITQFQLSQR